ncbi:hypothetical protein HKD37_10G028145 [Glycine soja]
MATPPRSPPQSDGQSEATSKRSRTTTRLRTLTLRTMDQPRPAVYVDPATGRASRPMREKFQSYLGVVAREKIPIIHNNWKDVPETLKEIVWNDILAKFDIPEATKVKTKVMSTSTLTSKFVFGKTEGQQAQDVVTKYGLDPEAWKQFEATRVTPNSEGFRKRAQTIQKHNDCPHLLSRGGYDLLEKKLLDEKRKRVEEESLLSENPASVDDPPSPIKRHVKWKDSLEEQVTQGSFVPHGQQDILNTAIGRPDHGGRVRAAGSGVTITQYYGRASRTCSNSSTSITQQQLDEVVARLREDMSGQIREELRSHIKEELRTQLEEENKRTLERMTMALKEAIKVVLSHKGSPDSVIIQPNIQQLGARVSTKGSNAKSNAQPSRESDGDVTRKMGLYVQHKDGTLGLVAMGKIMDGDSVIHTVAYADDVVRVSVDTVIDPDAEIPYATSEIKYVKQALHKFVAWPTNLVKLVFDEDEEIILHKMDAHGDKPANVDTDDPMRGLIKYSFDIYDKPVECKFDGTKFGIADAPPSIFLTYSDVSEIIAGDKSLNISWTETLEQGSNYAFLEPQPLVVSKETRGECEGYLERWLKESNREVYVGPYFHHVMTKLKTSLSPESKAAAPKWIEVKSHVQTGCYECGYYVMHWMWNIITSDIKSDWSMAEFDIPEASDLRTKKKILQNMGEQRRQFKSDLTSKWAFAADKESVDDTDMRKKAQAIQKHNIAPHLLPREGYEYLENKLMDEKRKKKLEEAAQSGSTDTVIDPPSPIRQHMKWKMARIKKTGQMTSEAAKEIAEKIVPHVEMRFTTPKMPSFRDLEQKWAPKVGALLEFQWRMKKKEKATINQAKLPIVSPKAPYPRKSSEKEVYPNLKFRGPTRRDALHDSENAFLSRFGAEMGTKGWSFVGVSMEDEEERKSNASCGFFVAIGRPEHRSHVGVVGVGLTIKKYFGLAPRTSRMSSSMAPEDLEQLMQQIRDQLEESITEKRLALPPEPEVGPSATCANTKESCVDPSGNDPDTGDLDKYRLYIEENPPCLVALGRVYEGSIIVHNIPLLHDQVKVGVEEVRDAYASIPVPTEEVKLVGQALNTFFALPTHLVKGLSEQVIWDAIMFGVFNEDFPLYIKYEDLSEITHGGQCLSISVIQLWILHMNETSIQAGNADVYGFLKPQSIQRSGQLKFESESYIKNWMQNSKQECFEGLDDTPQSKSKAGARWIVVKCNRQKGSTECGYYVMHWMSTIIQGSFKNNWETYFNDVRPLELERLKALRI